MFAFVQLLPSLWHSQVEPPSPFFSNIVHSCVSLVHIIICFCFLNNCTFNSKFKHLACQVSFSICISRNFCLTFFKHYVTNSISSLCLTNVMVSVFSWRIVAFFISSTTQVNVPSTITKYCCRSSRVSLASSSSWVFSNFYSISKSFWSNCLWANTSPTLFFSHSCSWASNSIRSI